MTRTLIYVDDDDDDDDDDDKEESLMIPISILPRSVTSL